MKLVAGRQPFRVMVMDADDNMVVRMMCDKVSIDAHNVRFPDDGAEERRAEQIAQAWMKKISTDSKS